MEPAKRRRTIRTAAVPVEWHTLPQDLFPSIVSHWDVATLIKKKRVCREWKQFCNDAMDAKRSEITQKAFQTRFELQAAVNKYCGYNEDTHGYSQQCSLEDAEEIATTYGWPINQWDVSNVQDFSRIFSENCRFNEDIGSWNVSNATSMLGTFRQAKAFNQDLSSWDVSNVTSMVAMFSEAVKFQPGLVVVDHWKCDRHAVYV
jgi:surface protein